MDPPEVVEDPILDSESEVEVFRSGVPYFATCHQLIWYVSRSHLVQGFIGSVFRLSLSQVVSSLAEMLRFDKVAALCLRLDGPAITYMVSLHQMVTLPVRVENLCSAQFPAAVAS